ncbi:MAG: lipid A biosynthesis acyltransferase, partial [Marinirhabdus sp.]
YLKIEKPSRGRYRATYITLAEDAAQYPSFEITRKFLDQLEGQIKAAPPYYLWTHKRWKHRERV